MGVDRRQHALFRRFPIDGSAAVDGRLLPTPYHVYDGTLWMLGGTAEAGAAASLLGEGLVPLLDTKGRALMAVWVGDFTQASLGPHQELQLSLFASTRPLPPVADHPFAIHRALLVQPGVRMVCVALWNSTPQVARYNAGHLGLNAHVAEGRLAQEEEGGHWSFRFERPDGALLAEGGVRQAVRSSPAMGWRLLRHMGLQGAWRLLRAPYLSVPVAAPGSQSVAQTHTHSDRQAVRPWAPGDGVAIAHPRYAPLDFCGAFVQHMMGLRFVYLRPR